MREPPVTRSRDQAAVRQLAGFRYQLRQFLRFSEKAARAAGITPQQYQLLLGVAGYTGRGWATISELAEFLQQRHNAVVGLVERASRCCLVSKEAIARDHRFVRVQLTPQGKRKLAKLAALHRNELMRFQTRTGLALAPARSLQKPSPHIILRQPRRGRTSEAASLHKRATGKGDGFSA